MRSIFSWLVSLGDALSQVVGCCIPFKAFGVWGTWTMSPNESISGAAERHFLAGKATGVRGWINRLFALFGDREHCRKAFLYDYARALAYVEMAEKAIPDISEEVARLRIYP